ncbi:MAG: thiamine diphosphokinase, partial [Firmicutes bacterium]|nr:thiamine diphosphokinase [Candidatus Caballimonas caccae]
MKIAIVLNSPNIIDKVFEDSIIYVDGGYNNKKYLEGKKTLAVVGDFDTLKDIPSDEKIIKLKKEKDFTDGERAVYLAKELKASEVSIYGATGGRIEHILGNIALLKLCACLSLKAKIIEKDCEIILCCGKQNLDIKKGTTISIIPYTDDCIVLESKGLYYPLNNLTLTKGDTRGISNYNTEDKVYINIEK